jgi:hypothetical protein
MIKRTITQIVDSVPHYTHDCGMCVYLGSILSDTRFSDTPQIADLYFCPQVGWPTVIARWSSEGGDYSSGLFAAGDPNTPLGFAKVLAIKAGLLPATKSE